MADKDKKGNKWERLLLLLLLLTGVGVGIAKYNWSKWFGHDQDQNIVALNDNLTDGPQRGNDVKDAPKDTPGDQVDGEDQQDNLDETARGGGVEGSGGNPPSFGSGNGGGFGAPSGGGFGGGNNGNSFFQNQSAVSPSGPR